MPQLAGDPKEMERRLGRTLAKLKGDEVLARNYAGVVRRFQKRPPTLTSVNIKPK